MDPDPDSDYQQNLIVSSLVHVLPFSGVGRILVWGAASRHRGGEVPKAPRVVGCGEGVSPSPPGEGSGEGAVPPNRNFFIII